MVPEALIDAQGFALVPGVLGHEDLDRLLGALADAGLQRSRAGVRGLLAVPAVRALAADARLAALAAGALGGRATAFRATLFDKSPRANWLVAWHQDTALPFRERRDVPGFSSWSLKAGVQHARAPAATLERVLALRVHLDDSRADNGPLRVLPGSHRLGVLSDHQLAGLAREREAITCLVERGGIVALRPLTVHASSKARVAAPRRVLHIEYARSLQLEQGLELAAV